MKENSPKKTNQNRGCQKVWKVKSRKEKRRSSNSSFCNSSSSLFSSNSNETHKSKRKRKWRQKLKSFLSQGKEGDMFNILNLYNQF